MKKFNNSFRIRLIVYIAALGLVAGAAWVSASSTSQAFAVHSTLAK